MLILNTIYEIICEHLGDSIFPNKQTEEYYKILAYNNTIYIDYSSSITIKQALRIDIIEDRIIIANHYNRTNVNTNINDPDFTHRLKNELNIIQIQYI